MSLLPLRAIITGFINVLLFGNFVGFIGLVKDLVVGRVIGVVAHMS